VKPEGLKAAEAKFGVVFPTDYRIQVFSVGVPNTTLALLSGILECEVELYELSELHLPDEIVEQTVGWVSAGMPGNLIAIGNDSGGNSFCFNKDDLSEQAVPIAPIYYWDHGLGVAERIADSFSSWISSYLEAWSDGLDYDDF